LIAATLVAGSIPARLGNPQCEKWQTGDIVFLNGTSLRSRVVRHLQGYSSDYSHLGMIIVEDDVRWVIHADPSAGKVVKQRWDVMAAEGTYCGGLVCRVRSDHGTAVASAVANEWASRAVPFDSEFDLRTNDQLYCTELVWLAYENAGLNLCTDAKTRHRYLLPAHLLDSSELRDIVRF
jgi:uncharacterized protein YycO